MKAFSIWGLEKASLGRGFFWLGFGCAARRSRSENIKNKMIVLIKEKAPNEE